MSRSFFYESIVMHAHIDRSTALPEYIAAIVNRIHARAADWAEDNGVKRYEFESLRVRPHSTTGKLVDDVWIFDPPNSTSFHAVYVVLEMEARA